MEEDTLTLLKNLEKDLGNMILFLETPPPSNPVEFLQFLSNLNSQLDLLFSFLERIQLKLGFDQDWFENEKSGLRGVVKSLTDLYEFNDFKQRFIKVVKIKLSLEPQTGKAFLQETVEKKTDSSLTAIFLVIESIEFEDLKKILKKYEKDQPYQNGNFFLKKGQYHLEKISFSISEEISKGRRRG